MDRFGLLLGCLLAGLALAAAVVAMSARGGRVGGVATAAQRGYAAVMAVHRVTPPRT